MFPIPWKLVHHDFKAGAMLWNTTTHARALAKPATKLLIFGCSDGRYRNPDPAECSGMMKMSYFPLGRLGPEEVVLGLSPWGGGGGGGGGLIAMNGPVG